MIVIAIIFALICMYGIKLAPHEKGGYMQDYMSVEKTTAIKGIFIFIVFTAHFDDYIVYTSAADIMFDAAFKKIGQRMVTLFMLYSGYGVMESIKKKGDNYIKGIPVKRVFGTLFRFDAAVLLYLIYGLAAGRKFSFKQVLLSFVAWDSLGNSNWYIFAILMLYIFTFTAFIIFRDRLRFIPAVAATALMTVVYVFVLGYFGIKESWWFDTVIIYPLGMAYSLIRQPLEKFINKNVLLWLLALAAAVALAVLTAKADSFACREISMISFTAAVVLITMKVSLNNAVLRFLGKHLFGIFILQRLPMIFLSSFDFFKENIYLFFAVSLAATVSGAYAFDKCTDALFGALTGSTKKKKSN